MSMRLISMESIILSMNHANISCCSTSEHGLPTVTSILERQSEYIASMPPFTCLYPSFHSRSEHLFRGQELLHRYVLMSKRTNLLNFSSIATSIYLRFFHVVRTHNTGIFHEVVWERSLPANRYKVRST